MTINNMASIVCQGLQSCLEPGLVEPRVLMHKLAPSITNYSQTIPAGTEKSAGLMSDQETRRDDPHIENTIKNENRNHGGWSFIEDLNNTCYNGKRPVTAEAEQVYVHPLVKRSSSALNTKSLEMCTESLGSETGSVTSDSSDEFYSLLIERENSHKTRRSKSGKEFNGKLNRSASFPPPLTSISGSEGVHVRSHREGGRLVIKAVTYSSSSSYFQTERVDGRLKLTLFKNASSENTDSELSSSGEDDVYEDEEDNEEETTDGQNQTKEEYCNDDDENGGYWEDEVAFDGGKVAVGEFPRPSSRCKENGNGNKVMPSWGALLVPIS